MSRVRILLVFGYFMNCSRFIRSIPKFLNDDLEIDDLREFIDHVENCEECREELTIEFLIREGLHSLESGSAFDLNKELKRRMENAQNDLRQRESVRWFFYALSGMVFVGLAVMILLLVFR